MRNVVGNDAIKAKALGTRLETLEAGQFVDRKEVLMCAQQHRDR